jgi:integrase
MQGNTIVFPPEIMKGNEQHTIPLLGGLRGNLPTLSKPFTNHSTAMQKFREALPRMPHWTAHDARRYFSSTMAKLHVPIDITEAILSHTAGSRSPVQRTYDRYDRLEPMRAALAKYEEYVLAVVSETANFHSAR